MKMDNQYLLIILLLMAGQAAFGQADTLVSDSIRVVVLDAPKPYVTRLIPNGISKNSVILVNDYDKAATISVSSDGKVWRQETIRARQPLILRIEKPQYKLILATDTRRAVQYSVQRGKRYQIYWDKSVNRLDLNPSE